MLYDLIIRGGTVYDGTGAPGVRADVAVRDGKLAAIGDLKDARAAREPQAQIDKLVEPTRRFLVLAGDRTINLDLDRARAYYRQANEVSLKVGAPLWGASALAALRQLDRPA